MSSRRPLRGSAACCATGAALALALAAVSSTAQRFPFFMLSSSTSEPSTTTQQPSQPPADWLPPPPANIPYDTCVCAFDFDGVLRAPAPGARDQDTPAPEARKVVQACKNAGWEVAICSANDNMYKLKLVLGQRLDPNIFTPQFMDSSALQMHYDNKTITLNNLIRFFDTQPQCVMLFDDRDWNRDYAEQTGSIFIRTPTDTGVTYYDFQRAQQYIPRFCDCAKPQDRSYNDFSRQRPDRSFLSKLKL